jgi:hypothetical protein
MPNMDFRPADATTGWWNAEAGKLTIALKHHHWETP